MRRLISALGILALAILWTDAAQAQTGSAKTPSALTNEINTLAADNTTNAFTLQSLRQITLDLVQSMLNNVQYGATAPSQFPQLPASPGSLWATLSGSAVAGDAVCVSNSAGSITLVDCGTPPPVVTTKLPPVSVTGVKTVSATDCGTTQVLAGSNYYNITFPLASSLSSGCFVQIYNNDSRAKQIISSGDFSSTVVWPGQVYNMVGLGPSGWSITPKYRWRTLNPVTLNVSPAGGIFPNVDCLGTGAQACRTIQNAVDMFGGEMDIGAQELDIQVADGTYTETLQLDNYVRTDVGNVHIKGHAGSPPSVSIVGSTPGAGALKCGTLGEPVDISWTIENLTLATTANAVGAVADQCSNLTLNNINYAGTQSINIWATDRAKITVLGTHTLTANVGTHIQATNGSSVIYQTGATIVCSGMTAVSTAFINASTTSFIDLSRATFSGCGSVTGNKLSLAQLSTVLTPSGNPTGDIPGNNPGSVSWSPVTLGNAATGIQFNGNGGATNLVGGSTQYIGISTTSSSITGNDYAIPAANYKLTNFTFTVLTGLTSGQSIVATLNLNQLPTSLTCTISVGSNSCTDSTDVVSVVRGNFLNVKVVSSASIPTTGGMWAVIGY